jgi:hypothetical protein
VCRAACERGATAHNSRRPAARSAEPAETNPRAAPPPHASHHPAPQFIADTADAFNVGLGATQTRLGVVKFSTFSELAVPLDFSTTYCDFSNAVQNLTYGMGSTNTWAGLNTSVAELQRAGRPASAGVSKVILTITDGRSNGCYPDIGCCGAGCSTNGVRDLTEQARALGYTVRVCGVPRGAARGLRGGAAQAGRQERQRARAMRATFSPAAPAVAPTPSPPHRLWRAQTAVITIGNRSDFNPSEIEYLSGNATRLQFALANYASLLGSIVGSIRAMACNEPVRIAPGTTVTTGVVLGGGNTTSNSTGGSGAFYGAYYNVTGPLDIRVNAGGGNGTNTSLTLCISYTNFNPSSAPGGNDGCATSVSDGGNTTLVITAHPNDVNSTVYIVCEGSGGNGTAVYLPFSLDGNPCGTVRVNLTTVTVTADGGAGSGAANGTSPNPGYNTTYYNVSTVVSNTTAADHPRCFSCPEDQVMLASSGVNAGVCAARCLSPRQWAWPFGRRLCQDCDASCYKCAPAGSVRDCLTCNDGFLLLPAAIDPTLTADQRAAAVAATGGVPTGRCVPYDGCPAGAFITSVPGEPYAEMCMLPTPTRSSSLSASGTPSGTVAPSSSPGASVTGSGTAAVTGSPTPSGSASAAATGSATPSGSASAAATGTASVSTTGTPSGSASLSGTPTATQPTNELSGSHTPPVTPSLTASLSGQASPSSSVSSSAAGTASPTGSMTPTLSGTGSVSASRSGTGSVSASRSGTGSVSGSTGVSATMTPTSSGTGTESPPATGTTSAAATPSGTASPPGTPSMTATLSGTGTTSGAPSNTASLTGTPSRTPSGTMTPSMTPTMTATSSGTPSLSGTPSTTGGAVVANCTDGGLCGGHGTCRLVGGAPTCVCEPGYSGATCGTCAPGAFSARVCAAVPGCSGPCRGATANTSNACFAYLPGTTTCPAYTLECADTTGPYAYNVGAPLCRACPGTAWAVGSYQADGVTTAPVGGSTCSGHGTCGASSGLCSCAAGWSGPSCGVPSPVLPGDPCAGVTCSGRGVCSAVTGAPVCACSLGYYGADCESSIDSGGNATAGARRLVGGSGGGGGSPPLSALYGWSAGVWTRCSALCGANGTMSRQVSCRAVVPVPPGDSGEYELDRHAAQEDHVCSHQAGLPRPATAVPCNRFACAAGNASDADEPVPAVVLTLGYERVFADDGPRLQPDSAARDAFLATVGAEVRAFLAGRLAAASASASAELRGVDPASLLPQEAVRVSITTGNQVVAVLASAANVLALLAAGAGAAGVHAVPLAASSPPAGSDGTGTSAVDLAVSLEAALADGSSSARSTGTWLRRADTGASAMVYAPLTASTEPGFDASLTAIIGVGSAGGGGGSSNNNAGAIAGGVVGGLAGLALLVAAALYVARSRARRSATHKAVSGKQVAAAGTTAADANYDDGSVRAYESNPMGVDPDSQPGDAAAVGHGTLLSSAPPRVLSHQDTASSAVLDYTQNPMPGAHGAGAGSNVKPLPRAGSGRFARGFNLGLLGSSTAGDIHKAGDGSASGASRDELRGAGPAGGASGGGARNRKTFAPSMSAIGGSTGSSSGSAATIATTGPVGGSKRSAPTEAAGSAKKAATAPPMLATAAASLGHSGTVVEVTGGAEGAAAAPSSGRPRRSREDGPARQGSATTIDVSGK